ncbi:39S ribosomal protein L42, mitochondrial isoform X2 [Varanus komodoensis]|uniref:39S ribosomal protein L42, mitochondrial isoform X2 n=1 Tax=Varanus komodoensis TaxID=61221 RepID=UPI001CF795D7|nr:39S ribosomal protein L42, mitochondrial isoform X2 [Varanus komodoensis]
MGRRLFAFTLQWIFHMNTQNELPGSIDLPLLFEVRKPSSVFHNLVYGHLWQPIPRRDPVEYKEETHDQVLKHRLEKEELKNKNGPTIEELSKMFYTTKHRWYPVGQYHMRRKKTGPKDR